MRNSLYLSLTLITCLTAFSPSLHAENEQHQHSHNSQKNTPNVANRERHPYVRAEEGRENYTLAGHQANEFRIYDFYQRQADYYMAQKHTPNIIPAFPGLDGGLHGHWGKYNQNGHKDDRWTKMKHEGVVGSLINSNEFTGEDGIAVMFDQKQNLYGIFSPRNFNFMTFYKGAFVVPGSWRWGTSSGATPKGQLLHKQAANTVELEESKYHGYYKNKNSYIFNYTLNNNRLLDMGGSLAGNNIITRTLECQSSLENFQLNLGLPTEDRLKITLKADADVRYSHTQETLNIQSAPVGAVIKIYYHSPSEGNNKAIAADRPQKLLPLTRGGSASINRQYSTKGTLSPDNKAYVIDNIDLPFKNNENTLFFLTGVDFNQKGDAFVSTLQGDIWKVTGIGKTLEDIHWTKIAAGLNQPFGLRLWDNHLHVLERTRVVKLHDLNNDDEIDFFESINNEIVLRNRSHSHRFGLERDKQGNIYFASDTLICKITAKEHKLENIAQGVRNCMGAGVTQDGRILFGPQEGTNTPASCVLEVKKGDSYGFKSKGPLTAPLCYIPRGVDNSTGGFYHMNDSRWGPLGNSLIGLSYGYGSWYQILQDKQGTRTQGATVPMQGEFLSGVVRAAKNPADGQLYTVGLDGWGDYATQDGCFQRIRYTGKTLYKPTSYKVYHNGLKITFPIKLNAPSVEKAENYFAHIWEYLNSKQYGSPEYSVGAETLGHNVLPVRSAKVLDDGYSLFVEIPQLQLCMQMHLRLHLEAADGHSFKTDLFPTIKTLGDYYPFEGAAAQINNKSQNFIVRAEEEVDVKLHTQSGTADEHAREIVIQTKNMQYDLKEIKVTEGESLLLNLKNIDGMPHNLVITTEKDYTSVGMASFKMLNDPKAVKKHYIPDMKEVLAYTFIVQPKGSHKLYLKAPTKGRYTFFCTFPGHWQLMKGTLIVE